MSDGTIYDDAVLDAVNEILAAIGESPVSTLEGNANTDVMSALRILNKHNRREQSLGWTFNTTEDEQLTPDMFSQLIPWQPTFLRVLPVSGGSPYTNRGGYVYDRTNKTDRFSGPVSVQLVELAGYDEMPEVFRAYVVAKAAKDFNISFFGAPEVDTVLSNELIDLKQALMEYEIDFGGFNAFNSDPFISQAVQR